MMTDPDPIERVTKEVLEAIGKIIWALTSQIDLLMFFEGTRRSDFITDTYFQRYAFGMFDATTMIFPLTLRQRVGRGIIQMGLSPFLKKEFGLTDLAISEMLDSLEQAERPVKDGFELTSRTYLIYFRAPDVSPVGQGSPGAIRYGERTLALTQHPSRGAFVTGEGRTRAKFGSAH